MQRKFKSRVTQTDFKELESKKYQLAKLGAPWFLLASTSITKSCVRFIHYPRI